MNSDITLRAIELAHILFRDNLADDGGHLVYDDKFFENLDKIIEKIHETRAFAEAMR